MTKIFNMTVGIAVLVAGTLGFTPAQAAVKVASGWGYILGSSKAM